MKRTTVAQRASMYEAARMKLQVREQAIYYHAYRTCIMSCSPFAIFQELIHDERFSDYEHVWVYGSSDVLEYDTFKRYERHPNVRFVEAGSQEQADALATCGYLITNAGLPTYWRKREGQTVINTWHGTPLKSLGKDARDFNGGSIGNAQRNFLQSDYLVMPNRYTADRILDSYCIDGIFRGTIIDAGSPRIDAVLNSDKKRTRSLLEAKYGSSLDGKRIVLYAPTFRSEHGKSVNTADVMAEHMSKLADSVPGDCVVFFKVHNTLGRFFVGNSIMESRLVFDEIETNELLAITDVLITDYSSIFFDFICTGRPVLFFVYDKEQYSAEHGMYADISEMPGFECRTIDDVLTCLEAIETGNYENPNQEDARKRFAYNDDGRATERVVDYVFRRQSIPSGMVDDRSNAREDDASTRALISLGNEPLLSAAHALFELLKTLDRNRYQVVIAAHNVHLIWKECSRLFPDSHIVFADLETASAMSPANRDRAFYREQMQNYFPHMKFDEYYNLKTSEGFIDEIVSSVLPDIPRYWHICWSGKLDATGLAGKAKQYQETVLYHAHAEELPRAIVQAPVKLASDLDVRNKPDHDMTILVLAGYDSMNYALLACANGLVARGHKVVVATRNSGDYVNDRMFIDAGFDVVELKAVDDPSLVFIDMVLASPIKTSAHNRIYRHIAKHNLLVFSFCNLFSSVAMRISPDFVFTLGEAKNEELRKYNLHYNCVAIGNPQYDALLPSGADRRCDPSAISKVLVVEQGGYPYGERGKKQLAEMLVRVAEQNPDMEFWVKPRYLPNDEKGAIHNVSEHVYDYLAEHPDNLNLMLERCSVEDIISDYDAVMTMWSTAFLDAVAASKPLILVGGFDSVDVFDVRRQRIEEAYEHLEATGCLHRYDALGAGLREEFRVVDEGFAAHEIYGRDSAAAPRVIRFLELAYETLVLPNLRIADDFSVTEEEYYRRFADFDLVDADAVAQKARRQYLAALNATLQERVYLNRCMGAVLDLSCLERFYDVVPPATADDRLNEFLADTRKQVLAAYDDACSALFKSERGMRLVESDRILQDFYFDWLYETGRYDALKNPPIANLLAGESQEYNLALLALKRYNLPGAYKHLFRFLRTCADTPIVQLLKCKRIRASVRPFKKGALSLPFFAELMKDENEPVIRMLYREPDRMPLVALKMARSLNRQGEYEECVVLCDKALLHHSAKGKRDDTLAKTAKLYAKKVFYRAILHEEERARALANERV